MTADHSRHASDRIRPHAEALRVLQVSHYALPHAGGIESVVHELASELASRGNLVSHVASAAVRPGEGISFDAPYDRYLVPARNPFEAGAFAFYYLGEHDRLLERLRERFRLEHGLALGAAFLIPGLVVSGVVVIEWLQRGLGTLSEERLALVGITLVILGLQTIFGAFFISILGLRRRPPKAAPDAA